MKKTALVITLCIFFLASLFAKAQIEKPLWVDNWKEAYPDEMYIAQLGTVTGKKGNKTVKAVAANNVARYLQTKVSSETSASMNSVSSTDKNGKIVTSNEKSLSQNINVSVDITLTSLEYTEPWFNKAEKTWYCVAYVSREKLFEQYRPNLQNARDKLFSFYDAVEKTNEPLYKIFFFTQSKGFEEEFLSAYAFSNLISASLTSKYYQKDSTFISSISSRLSEEKNKCIFAITVSNDVNKTVYQTLKELISREGYSVLNSSENSLYQVEAKVHLEDNPIGALHVITPSLEVAITGNKKAFFSYAKQPQMLNGLNEGIVKTKAINALSEEIKNTFLDEFNAKIGENAKR